MPFNILVVEDDIVQQTIISLMLRKKLGMTVIEVKSAAGALEHLKNNQHDLPHAVLTDYLMPEMNGLELLEICRQQYPSLPVIMLTSNNDSQFAAKAIEKGFVGKPFTKEKIFQYIEKCSNYKKHK